MSNQKTEKPILNWLNNIIKGFNKQSLCVFVPWGIFVFSYIFRFFALDIPEKENQFLYVWNSFDVGLKEAFGYYSLFVAVVFALCVLGRIMAKKDRVAKEKQRIQELEEIIKTIHSINAKSGEIYNTYKETQDELKKLRETTDDDYVKYILDPGCHALQEIENEVQESYGRIGDCAKIDDAENIAELNKRLREAENIELIVEEKKKALKSLFKLVENATANISERYRGVVGIYLFYNDDVDRIIKIVEKENGKFEAIVHDGDAHNRFDVIFANIDDDRGVASLILSCSEHKNIEIYSCDVNFNGITEHGRKHSCVYIKNNNRGIVESYSLVLLEEHLMVDYPLSNARINDNYREIVGAADKRYKLKRRPARQLTVENY